MTVKDSYSKPPLTAADQVRQLQARGLVIADQQAAEDFFKNNSYYRFSAYTFIFEDVSVIPEKRLHTLYTKKPTFEQVYRYYIFDHLLRELMSHALRHIEVGIKTRICLELALAHNNGHFYLDPLHFKSAEIHNGFLTKCHRESSASQETFIKHYRKKYTPELPPLWMMIEILTFGQISMFFSNLTTTNQKIVSRTLDLSPDGLASWLASLSYTRNLCAHHSRLWNRWFTKIPQGSSKLPTTELRSFAQSVTVAKYLADKVEPSFDLSSRLKKLLSDYPEILPIDLGFRQMQLNDPFWSN